MTHWGCFMPFHFLLCLPLDAGSRCSCLLCLRSWNNCNLSSVFRETRIELFCRLTCSLWVTASWNLSQQNTVVRRAGFRSAADMALEPDEKLSKQ